MRELICNKFVEGAGGTLALANATPTELFHVKLPQGEYHIDAVCTFSIVRGASDGANTKIYFYLAVDGVEYCIASNYTVSTAIQDDQVKTCSISKGFIVHPEGSTIVLYGFVDVDGTITTRQTQTLSVDIWREV